MATIIDRIDPQVADTIRAGRRNGKSFAEISRDLAAAGTLTVDASTIRRWWLRQPDHRT